MTNDAEAGLMYAIEEAFHGDFAALKERAGLENTEIETIKNLQDDYFLQFSEFVKAHIAMKAKVKKGEYFNG